MQQLESDLDVTQEKLMNANQRLEEKEKALQNAEGEVAALNRRVASLEEDLEKSEERLLTATQKLDLAATAGDDSQRMCKVLENKALSDEARMESLENQLKDARILAEEADKKYDDKHNHVFALSDLDGDGFVSQQDFLDWGEHSMQSVKVSMAHPEGVMLGMFAEVDMFNEVYRAQWVTAHQAYFGDGSMTCEDWKQHVSAFYGLKFALATAKRYNRGMFACLGNMDGASDTVSLGAYKAWLAPLGVTSEAAEVGFRACDENGDEE